MTALLPIHNAGWRNEGHQRRGAWQHAGVGALAQEDVFSNTVVHLLNSDESQAEQESMIVAQAGMAQHITVATNMAGRGTDILLGGDPAQLLLLVLAQPYNQAVLQHDPAYNAADDSIALTLAGGKYAAEVQVCGFA